MLVAAPAAPPDAAAVAVDTDDDNDAATCTQKQPIHPTHSSTRHAGQPHKRRRAGISLRSDAPPVLLAARGSLELHHGAACRPGRRTARGSGGIGSATNEMRERGAPTRPMRAWQPKNTLRCELTLLCSAAMPAIWYRRIRSNGSSMSGIVIAAEAKRRQRRCAVTRKSPAGPSREEGLNAAPMAQLTDIRQHRLDKRQRLGRVTALHKLERLPRQLQSTGNRGAGRGWRDWRAIDERQRCTRRDRHAR